MNRRVAVALVSVAVATTTIIAPRIGTHTAVADPGPPVVISGTVVDSTGGPVSGAVVSLYPDRLDGVPTVALDSQVTDSSGTYSLTTDLTADLSQIASGHQRYVNFELDVESLKLTSSTFFSRQWSDGKWVQGEASPANGTVTLAPGGAGVAKTPRALARILTTSGVQANSNPGLPCTTVDKRVPGTSQQRLTVIGELHTANDATETYTYGKSSFAESDISIATSLGGANWSLSGSVHMSDKNMGGTDVRKTAHENVGTRIGSYFQYAEFKRFQSCPTPRGTVTTFLRNEVKPTNWNGGVEIGRNYDNHYLDGHCPPLPNRRTQSFTTDTEAHTLSEKQVTFSNAASVSIFGVGVSLEAQSGWSKNVESEWSFGHAAPHHYLCGNTGPYRSSPRIFAGLQQ